MTAEAPAAPTARQAPPRPGFRHTLASEWAKLFSVRSTYITIALGLVLSIGMTALVAVAVGSTFDDWGPAEQADFDPTMFALVGIIFGLIVFSVFGVLAVSGEYSSGMIRLTLTATPQRGRVLAAKALIVAAVTLVAGLVIALGMFFAGQAVMASFDMPTVGLDDPDAQRAVLGVGLTIPLFPLIGLALGFLLRSTAGAITAVLAIVWIPEIFEGLLPMWWRENIVSLLPGPAIDSVTIGHLVDSPTFRDPAIGGVIAAVWLVAFLAAAYVSLARRDA